MLSLRPVTCTWKGLILNEALAVIVMANVGCHVAVGDLSDSTSCGLFLLLEKASGDLCWFAFVGSFCGMRCCSGRWLDLTWLFGNFLRHFQGWSVELEPISELLCRSTDSRKAFSSGNSKSGLKASGSSSSALATMQCALLLVSRCKHPSLRDHL